MDEIKHVPLDRITALLVGGEWLAVEKIKSTDYDGVYKFKALNRHGWFVVYEKDIDVVVEKE